MAKENTMRFFRSAARLASVLLVVGLGACEDFLDVNDNPNAPETAVVDIRLPALEAEFIHSTYYGENSMWGAEWMQQFAYNRETRSYSQVQRYELSETDASGAWDYFYTRPGNASYTMIQDATGTGDDYYHGLGLLFKAWTFQIITDLWGPVPYEEAFRPEIREPKYDDQKTVYAGILGLLDSAIVDLSSPNGRALNTNDLLYGGDISKWVKLAHFLQARAQLRIAYAPGEDKVQRANNALSALSGALASNADDADFVYPGGDDARNPLWIYEDQQNLFVASEYLVEMLKSRDDPRLPIMFTPVVYDSVRGTTSYPAATVKYVGHANGTAPIADSTVSWIGPYFADEDAPLNIVSYSDQKFT
jgi:hypothetical protein